MAGILYLVRDTATQGCDFLLWGEDQPGLAALSFIDAIGNGLNVELVRIPSDQIDPHTHHLIFGE